MKTDKIACHCRNITYGKIEKAIREGARSFEEVQERTGCSKSCGKCQEFIRYLVGDLLKNIENSPSSKDF